VSERYRMPLFAESDACRGGANCATCRDYLGGESWRREQMRSHDVPDGVSIWPCPDGKPWTNTGGIIPPVVKVTSVAGSPSLALAASPVVPVPAAEWPAWTKLIVRLKKPDDKGVGSTVQRLTGKWGKKFEAWMKKAGADCGCSARRERWDALYPY
jgi:hypothetical protein